MIDPLISHNRRRLAGIMIIATLQGCASDLEQISFDRIDRLCGQQCTKAYSECQSDWTVLAPYQSYQCGEAMEACIAACPQKGLK